MDEDKAQRLHDTLAMLKPKGRGGLGLGGGYNFPGSKVHKHGGSGANGGPVTTTTREDGLPNNALYANFVREGSFDPEQHSRNPFGDGRVIKRNFDDCMDLNGCESNSDHDDGSNGHARRKKAKRKELSKEEKKAARKEAKRHAKFEAKKAAKLEEKRAAKRAEKLRRKQAEGQNASGWADDPMVKKGTLDHRKQSEDEGKNKRKGSKECGQEIGCAAIVSSTDGGEDADFGGTETKKKKKKHKGRKRNQRNGSVDHDGRNDLVPMASRDAPAEKVDCSTKGTMDEDHSEKYNNCHYKSPEKGKKLKKKKRKRDADSATSKEKLMPEKKSKKAKKKKR